MSQIDRWEMAAECARAIEASSDVNEREMLMHLRTLWINLANEGQLLGKVELAEQIVIVSRIHADVMQRAHDEAASVKASDGPAGEPPGDAPAVPGPV